MGTADILLLAIDRYLDAPAPPHGDPTWDGYVSDLRELLSECAEELETRPEVESIDDRTAHTDEPAVDGVDVPVSARERRRINKRNAVHDTLIEVEWNCTKAAEILGMDRKTVWRLARRYWPDHPPFENAKISKSDLLRALLEHDWDGPKAAAHLGVRRTTVWRAMQRYNLRRPTRDDARTEATG